MGGNEILRYVLTFFFFIFSLRIVFEDFKSRLISLWLIIVYSLSGLILFLIQNPLLDLLINSIFCACYLVICLLILKLYFFLKEGNKVRLIDNKIGIADIILIMVIGSLIKPEIQTCFFSATLVLTLLLHLLSNKRDVSVPLAAYLVIAYLIFFGTVLYIPD